MDEPEVETSYELWISKALFDWFGFNPQDSFSLDTFGDSIVAQVPTFEDNYYKYEGLQPGQSLAGAVGRVETNSYYRGIRLTSGSRLNYQPIMTSSESHNKILSEFLLPFHYSEHSPVLMGDVIYFSAGNRRYLKLTSQLGLRELAIRCELVPRDDSASHRVYIDHKGIFDIQLLFLKLK